MRRKRRSPLLTLLTLFVLAVLCVGAALAAGVLVVIPTQAGRVAGPAAPGLSLTDRIYLSARLLLVQNDLTQPVDPGGAKRPFRIQLGEPTGTMIQRLQDEGIIRNAGAFRIYLQYSGLDTSLQAGDYELSPAMTAIQIAHALQDATPAVVVFRILPGWRMEEVAASLPTSGLSITPEEFLATASRRPQGYSFSEELPAEATAEGFLYPDSYQLPRDLTPDGLVNTFLKDFDAKLTPEIVKGFHNQDLTVYEGVTLASMVEREAVSNEEMPLIASVFVNRLAAGMKLDSDPTVQYALGYSALKETWWTNPLSLDDLKVNSRYNTYLFAGLPPGPIANPSLAALQAAALPAQTPYYYFRSACDGSGKHVFAETFEEHLKNACP